MDFLRCKEVLKLELDDRTKIILIKVYAPTANAPEQDLLNFCAELDEAYNKE